VSLPQVFPPRSHNCVRKPKGRIPTEVEREAALQRAGMRNLGDPNGPPPRASRLADEPTKCLKKDFPFLHL
jgi:hypothetical protein